MPFLFFSIFLGPSGRIHCESCEFWYNGMVSSPILVLWPVWDRNTKLWWYHTIEDGQVCQSLWFPQLQTGVHRASPVWSRNVPSADSMHNRLVISGLLFRSWVELVALISHPTAWDGTHVIACRVLMPERTATEFYCDNCLYGCEGRMHEIMRKTMIVVMEQKCIV